MDNHEYTPIVKEVNPMNFLFFRTKTIVDELGRFVGIVARELYRDAVFGDLEVVGPVYWNYVDFKNNERKPFILEIALPVAEIPSDFGGKFQLKRTEKFSSLSVIHEGSWYDIPKSYQRLMEFAGDRQFKLSGLNREIYIHIDFTMPQANVTEIQLGILPESADILHKAPLQEIENFSDPLRFEMY